MDRENINQGDYLQFQFEHDGDWINEHVIALAVNKRYVRCQDCHGKIFNVPFKYLNPSDQDAYFAQDEFWRNYWASKETKD